jgi:hypothetical protein
MKKLISLFILIVCTTVVTIAQQSPPLQPDQRLYDVFEEEYIEQTLKNNANLLLYYNLFLSNSYFLMEIPEEKPEVLEEMDHLDIDGDPDPEKFNPLKYEINPDFKKRTILRWGRTCTVIVFYSGEEFTKLYNVERKKYGLLTVE